MVVAMANRTYTSYEGWLADGTLHGGDFLQVVPDKLSPTSPGRCVGARYRQHGPTPMLYLCTSRPQIDKCTQEAEANAGKLLEKKKAEILSV